MRKYSVYFYSLQRQLSDFFMYKNVWNVCPLRKIMPYASTLFCGTNHFELIVVTILFLFEQKTWHELLRIQNTKNRVMDGKNLSQWNKQV